MIQKFGLFRKKSISYSSSPENLTDIFLEYKPQVIWGSRAFLDILAYELNKRTTIPKGLKLIMSGAEIINKNTRNLYKKIFGIDITEIYGSVETGITAYETPDRDGLHLCDDLTFFEFLDKNNNPVKDGGTGRIIVTSLIGFTMPFIRYDQGDLAKIRIINDNHGNLIHRISKIVGRNNDYLVLPDGRRLFDHCFDDITYRFKEILQLRVIQKTKKHFQINIAAKVGNFTEIKAQVMDLLSKILPEYCTYDVLRVDFIEPDGTGKLKMLISELQEENGKMECLNSNH
jgi:phenylacetate-CoA ligase